MNYRLPLNLKLELELDLNGALCSGVTGSEMASAFASVPRGTDPSLLVERRVVSRRAGRTVQPDAMALGGQGTNAEVRRA